ncbi:MAG: hypothetical protein HY924_05155 [Elusimicrobia bacterium]|nr:hypothetical protein [Elusimicrobiota bacterium]
MAGFNDINPRPGAPASAFLGWRGIAALTVLSLVVTVLAFTDVTGRLAGLFAPRGSGSLADRLKDAKERGRSSDLEALPDRSASSLVLPEGADPSALPEVDYAAALRSGPAPMGVLSQEKVEAVLNQVESRRTDMSVRPEDLVGGPFAGRDYFQGGFGASKGAAMDELLRDVEVPAPGGTAGVRPTGGDRVSLSQVRDLLSRQHQSFGRTKFNTGQGTPFAQLVYGRNRAADHVEGVTHETAAAAIDSVYDGRPFEETRRAGTAPPVTGTRPSSAGDFGNPTTASADQRLAAAQELVETRQRCEAADAAYETAAKPLREALKSATNGILTECKSWMKCQIAWPQTDQGCLAWSKGKLLSDFYYRWCRCSMHQCSYASNCGLLNRASCERTRACPLTSESDCIGMDCGD